METHPDLLLLCWRAAQQHVEQDVRQQVDGDLVVVFDDEATALEHLAGQLMSHLEYKESTANTAEEQESITVFSLGDRLTLLIRYPAQVADQSENLLPLLLRYTGFFILGQFTSF